MIWDVNLILFFPLSLFSGEGRNLIGVCTLETLCYGCSVPRLNTTLRVTRHVHPHLLHILVQLDKLYRVRGLLLLLFFSFAGVTLGEQLWRRNICGLLQRIHREDCVRDRFQLNCLVGSRTPSSQGETCDYIYCLQPYVRIRSVYTLLLETAFSVNKSPWTSYPITPPPPPPPPPPNPTPPVKHGHYRSNS